jgi:hypothetical protein
MVARSEVHNGRDSCGEVGPAPGVEAAPARYKPHVRPHFIVNISDNNHREKRYILYLVVYVPKRLEYAGMYNMLKYRLLLRSN